MKRVEKEVPGRVNDGAWNLEKDPFVPAEPRRPKLARPDEPANPRPIVGRNSRGCDVWLLHSKQGEVGRNIVRRGVDRDLKQYGSWILAEIDNGPSWEVPTSRLLSVHRFHSGPGTGAGAGAGAD